MPIIAILIAVAAIAPIGYFAVSKKSTPALRRAAIIAMILIVLSGAVCSILLFTGGFALTGNSKDPLNAAPVETAKGGFGDVIIIFLVFLVSVGIIAFVALREWMRSRNKLREEAKNPPRS